MATTLICSRCFKAHTLDLLVPHMGAYLCLACYEAAFNTTPEKIRVVNEARAAEREELQRVEWRARAERHPRALSMRQSDVILTTADTVAGYRIEASLDVITAECAFGMNVFRDFFAAVRDVVGGRSDATQKVLRDARLTCLAELRAEAIAVGGNAVIGVRLDYSELSGGGKSMMFLVASGTAVVVSPQQAAAPSAPLTG